eukprot:366344-Chlamydomonas_euryale.AAC.4
MQQCMSYCDLMPHVVFVAWPERDGERKIKARHIQDAARHGQELSPFNLCCVGCGRRLPCNLQHNLFSVERQQVFISLRQHPCSLPAHSLGGIQQYCWLGTGAANAGASSTPRNHADSVAACVHQHACAGAGNSNRKTGDCECPAGCTGERSSSMRADGVLMRVTVEASGHCRWCKSAAWEQVA